jgi:diaminopimelate decarboxylase
MNRPSYEKPSIIRHAQNISNQFGEGLARRQLRDIDGVPAAELLEAHGSPLFVFSERSMRAKAAEMRAAFRGRYPRVCFGWSYKTNHLDAVCGLFHQEGWAAEVVSGAEYAMARRLGVPGPGIIFNGACKPQDALQRAADEGAFIQIDHADELALLDRITRRRAEPLGVGLRVNLTIDALGISWDRFGFHLESGEAMQAARQLGECRRLNLIGLHCHLGTYITQPEAYRQAADRLAELALEIEDATGQRIEVINLGGGFPSHTSLHTQYGMGEHTPPLEAFADAIAGPLRARFGKRLPLLILESGRALVDEAGTLLSTVMGTRRIPGGERALVLDAGVNLLYTAAWYRHDVVALEAVPGALEDTTLYGPLCMAIDVVRRSVLLPPLQAGHHIAFRPVGAYNVTQWMQFSQMRPALVMVCEDGSVEVIRRREWIEDVKDAERLPPRFQPAFPRAPKQLEAWSARRGPAGKKPGRRGSLPGGAARTPAKPRRLTSGGG